MARPKALRLIENIPEVTWFKPAGLQRKMLDEVSLTLDEIEAIRLADLEANYQGQVAEKMNVSRQTVGRILASAHKKIAEALVLGKAIRLEGGSVHHQKAAADQPPDDQVGADSRKLTRVVVTASGPDLKAKVDLKFGRAAYLLIVDLTDDTFQVIDNSDQPGITGKKGVRTANKVLAMDIGAVITGNIGQRALSELSGAGIGMFQVDGGTVKKALTSYRKEVIDFK